MLPIRRALENTLVAYLQQMADTYSDCTDLTAGVGWDVQADPASDAPPTSTARPIVPGHTAAQLPKPSNLIVVADSADNLPGVQIWCVTVKFKLLDAGTAAGLAAQEKTTLALMAVFPCLEYGGGDMARAVAVINSLPAKECFVLAYKPSKPFDREGRDDRHFGSELSLDFEAQSLPQPFDNASLA